MLRKKFKNVENVENTFSIYSAYCFTTSIHIVSFHKRLSLKLLSKTFLLFRNIEEVNTKGFQEFLIENFLNKKTKDSFYL